MTATARLEQASLQPKRWNGPSLPVENDRRSHLEAVATRQRRRAKPRLFYAGVTVLTVLVIVVAQLLLSISVSQGAYEIGNLQSTQSSLHRSFQSVSEEVNTLSSPQNLAANANALGMVSNGTPVYLRLSDGAVLGSPAAASGSAGTVTGASGNLVPNALLAGVPLVTQTTQPGTSRTTTSTSAHTDTATPATNTTPKPAGPVALEGALPSPTTH